MTTELKHKIVEFDAVRNELRIACGQPEFAPTAKKQSTIKYSLVVLAVLVFLTSCATTYCPPSTDNICFSSNDIGLIK